MLQHERRTAVQLPLGLMGPVQYAHRLLMCTGWFLTAPFVGAYSKPAQDGYVGPAALAAAKGWTVGMPLGLVFRSVAKGYAPATSFIVVTMGVTGVLLIGWRSALAAVTTPEVRSYTAA